MQCRFKEKLYQKRYLITAIILVAAGVFVRVFRFGSVPGGFNQDEAFAAYEAFSLLNYGVDSAGYTNPTYFVSWGSGMNVLESYLAMPFMWLFGYNEIAFRLPQLICAIISMPVFYLLLRRLFNEKIALIGLGLLAVSPWHIMLSRWGLESNLAPTFLLLGLFFLVKGLEKNGFLLLSALFYGISLYAYSITWLAVPIMLVSFGIYMLRCKIKLSILTTIGACFVLFILALPHILFLAVNQGWIPEIRTAFISIPKMVAMRSGEISLKNLISPDSAKNLISILLYQNDGLSWNSIDTYGMFYIFSLVFLFIGMGRLIKNIKNDKENKKFSPSALIILGFVCCIFVCLLLNGANINKSNSLHFFTLIITAVGIESIVCIKHLKYIKGAVISLYAVFFVLFSSYYFGDYNTVISAEFCNGVGEAVELVNSRELDSVAVDQSIYHSQILFYDKTPHHIFENTVKYKEYPSPYLSAESFGKYSFTLDYNDIGDYDAYIITANRADWFAGKNYEVHLFQNYAVAIPLAAGEYN